MDNQKSNAVAKTNQTAADGPRCLDRLVRRAIRELTPEEMALGWLRYEAVRKLNARNFGDLCLRNLHGERFDDMVDELIVKDHTANVKLSCEAEQPKKGTNTNEG